MAAPNAARQGHRERPDFVGLVAENVRAAAGRRNIRQADLVRATSISKSTLSRKWSGQDPYDIAELVEIAGVLRMPVPELLGTTGQIDDDTSSLALAA